MHDLFAHVPVLDTGARGSTTTFAQRGIGDVLLAWENEAYLAEQGARRRTSSRSSTRRSRSSPSRPSRSSRATSHSRRAEGAAAKAYLDCLYSPEGQAIALKNFYRAWDTSAADPADVARFPKLELVTIDDFGGWKKVQPEHFGDGGVFDQIYTAEVDRNDAAPRPSATPSALPGFGLAFGITMTMLSIVVILPIGALLLRGVDDRRRRALDRRSTPSGSGPRSGCPSASRFLAALFNLVFGLALAWVLARYRFPGRRLIDAAVDLPFALPTAVAGIALTALYAPNGALRAARSRRSGSRSPTRRSASSSRWSSSACRSSCARCSR